MNNDKIIGFPKKKVPLLLVLFSLGLLLVIIPASERGRIHSRRPDDWPLLQETQAARFTNDIRIIELVPSISIIFHGERFTTNRWGMRDRDYELTPPPGTYRIVIFGSSIVMGSGVADSEVFERLLEDRLNEEFGGKSYAHYEILNFGVAGHASLQGLYVFQETALKFNPNAVFIIAHQLEEKDFIPGLANRLRIEVEMPYPEINEIVKRAGIEAGMSQEEIERLIQPFAEEIVSWTYQRIVSLSDERGILPGWIFLPTIEFSEPGQDYKTSLRRAEEAGFITFDLSDIYNGIDVRSLMVAEWDLHPNRRGHQLIADRLYQALLTNSKVSDALGFTK